MCVKETLEKNNIHNALIFVDYGFCYQFQDGAFKDYIEQEKITQKNIDKVLQCKVKMVEQNKGIDRLYKNDFKNPGKIYLVEVEAI